MTSIPPWAVRGARVICVDARWSSLPPARPLALRAVYTIEQVITWHAPSGDRPMLLLRETVNPIEAAVGFAPYRFRPLVSLEDDLVAHFNALLDVKQPVQA